MAVTITKISGIGGNPPTGIQVEGTASGCEKVYVTVSCSTDPVVPIDIPTGATIRGRSLTKIAWGAAAETWSLPAPPAHSGFRREIQKLLRFHLIATHRAATR